MELSLFQKYHYKGEVLHIEEHNHFIEKVKSFIIQDYLKNRTTPVETLHYLRDWFKEHMLKTDMEYCRYFEFKEIMKEIMKEIDEEFSAESRKLGAGTAANAVIV